MSHNVISPVFRPLYGLPCWGVSSGYGSSLTMEFGEPHLEVCEPRALDPNKSAKFNRHYSRRSIWVRGEWHLWFDCCEWNVFTRGKLIGHSALQSSSKRPINRAAAELDGQKLMQISVNPLAGTSVFEFDLGSCLETRPYDGESEQWLLFEPSGYTLCWRADGKYSHSRSNVRPDDDTWKSLNSQVEVKV